MVFSSSSLQPVSAGANFSFFIGRQFHRSAGLSTSDRAPAVSQLSETLDHIVAHRWGAFIAWVDDPARARTSVYRDPSGGMPCYYRRLNSLLIISSNIACLEAMFPAQLSIDWTSIVAELLYPDLRGRATGLEAISELLPGEAIAATPDGIAVCSAWTPAKFLRDNGINGTFDQAVAEVGAAVRSCTSTWYASFDRILLNLSGGLDSSVLAAACDVTDKLACITLVSSSGSGDERQFAGDVARHCGHSLYERFPVTTEISITLSAAARRPRPSARSFTQALFAHSLAVARQVEANAIVYGSGGDNVFCFLRSATPASDRLLREGLGRGFLGTVLDVATVTECSVPLILRTAFRKALTRGRTWRWPRDERLLTRELLESTAKAPDHPWLDEMDSLPVGKREHVAAIMQGLALTDYLESECGPPVIYPLLSQPVVEACLKIPTWIWYRGGVNRAPIRAAFANDLPLDIVARTSKGGFSGLARDIYLENHEVIKSLLLDGTLCRHAIIDRRSLEAAMAEPPGADDHRYVRILRLADVEAWASAQSTA